MRAIAIAVFAGSLAFAQVADAAVSRFKFARGVDREEIAHYDALVVEQFEDAVRKRPKSADDAERFAGDVAAVSERIALKLHDRLAESGKYRAVSQAGGTEPTEPGALLVGGKLTVFKRANVATRYLGLGAGSKLEGVVTVSDAGSGKLLGTIRLDFSSSGIPGFTNLVQTVDAFIEGIAVRVADEVMIAQGRLHRVQTGRSARLRDKYQ